MEVTLHQNDSFRVSTDMRNNFIDVSAMTYEAGIKVQSYPTFHYIEMREKDDQIATFYFKTKGIKKEVDLGWWQDAEVVFSRNKVRHK